MIRTIGSKTITSYEVRCPHCRSTVEHPKHMTVEIDTDDEGSILDIRTDCSTVQGGQDRT